MHVPASKKRLIDLARAAALALVALEATAQSAAPGTMEIAVERTAREQLLAEAGRAGLIRPVVKVSVAAGPGGRPGTQRSCPEPVRIEPADTRMVARMRFRAICEVPGRGWRTDVIVRGSLSAQVVVAATAIGTGKPIATTDLALEDREITAITEAVSDVGQVVGRSSRRTLRSGQVISPRWLAEALLVKRNDTVSILARQTGIEVQVRGEALEAGHRNDVISVRNVATGKVIRARVLSSDSVEPADLPAR